MISLNILTRISRITNLRQIYESISKNSENFNIIWWTLLDVSSITEIPTDILVFLNEKSKLRFYDSSKDDYLLWGGINKTIDEIEDGLVYILDDDNIIHPNFYPSVQNWLNNDSQTEINVSDMVGKKVLEVLNTKMPRGSYKYLVNLTQLSDGFYLMSIKTDTQISTSKIIINK